VHTGWQHVDSAGVQGCQHGPQSAASMELLQLVPLLHQCVFQPTFDMEAVPVADLGSSI